jgi:hypothetical protein
MDEQRPDTAGPDTDALAQDIEDAARDQLGKDDECPMAEATPPEPFPPVISNLLRDVARLNDWKNGRAEQVAPPRQPPRDTADLADRFIYHPPSSAGKDRHADLSAKILAAALSLDVTCPPCREKSLAMTKLEEAKFWASAAVARNPETR